MPEHKPHDLITDQEIAFARLILSGTVSDHRAAEAVGFKPGVAAYIKAKPRVVAFMQQHRAATQQQIVEHEADSLRQRSLLRQQVLERLWQIAT